MWYARQSEELKVFVQLESVPQININLIINI